MDRSHYISQLFLILQYTSKLGIRDLEITTELLKESWRLAWAGDNA